MEESRYAPPPLATWALALCALCALCADSNRAHRAIVGLNAHCAIGGFNGKCVQWTTRESGGRRRTLLSFLHFSMNRRVLHIYIYILTFMHFFGK